MESLLYAEFHYNGERLGLAAYIDRILSTPHPPRSIKEEERAVANAIERPIIVIHLNACERLVCDAADYMRYEIAQVVDIVRQYTWLSEDSIWKVAYEILWWKTMQTREERR